MLPVLLGGLERYDGGMGSGGPNGGKEGQYNLLGLLSTMTMMAEAVITKDCKASGKKPWGSVPSTLGDNKGRDLCHLRRRK
jgi:hypothetical protein